MRLNLAVIAVAGATMLVGIGCGEGEGTTEESSNDLITVTEMTLLPDGNWDTTSTRTVPRGPALRADVGNGVEVTQSPLYFIPCTNSWQVALWNGSGYSGNQVLCLNTNGNTGKVPIGWIFPARSVYTVTPLYVYDANNNVVFMSCTTSGRGNGSLSPAGTSVQEASLRTGACAF